MADIAPYVYHALELFGPDRLMFGSDWPAAPLRGGYAKVWHETKSRLEGFHGTSESGFWGEPASIFIACVSPIGPEGAWARTTSARCGRKSSMTSSRRPSFTGIRECKRNGEAEIENEAA